MMGHQMQFLSVSRHLFVSSSACLSSLSPLVILLLYAERQLFSPTLNLSVSLSLSVSLTICLFRRIPDYMSVCLLYIFSICYSLYLYAEGRALSPHLYYFV